MMKQYIFTLLFLLAGLVGMAQTNEPLPSGAVQFSNQLWLNPADSTIWTGDAFEGKFVNLGSWRKVDSLLALKADASDLADYYTQSQIDAFLALKADESALDDFYTKLEVDGLLGGYVPTSRTVNGKPLTGNITLNADDVGALQSGDNVSELTNDAGYITAGDIPAAPVTSVNGKTGAVMVTASDVGLGNVDNTSDLNKPISVATQSALDGKENAFSKGSLVAGTGVTLSGIIANRLVGAGDVTISAANSLTASNGLQISSGNITPIYGTSAGTVAQGNDTRINNGQTAFSWGNYRDWGLGSESLALISPASAWDITRGASFIRSNSGSAANNPFPQPGVSLHIPYLSSGGANQLFFGITSDGMYFRRQSTSGTWGPVRTVWHDGNFTPPSVFTISTNGLVPSPGSTSGERKYLDHFGNWTVPEGGGGGGTATDLTIQNRTSTTLQIGSSTGLAATIPAATTTLSGLMTASDKSTLNSALTSESDPTVPSHVKGITTGDVSRWDTAFSWGNYRDWGLGASAVTLPDVPAFDLMSRNTGFIRTNSASNTPFNDPGAGIHINYTPNRAAQLWFPVVEGDLKWRSAYTNNAWGSVRTIWDSGNFTPSDYLQTSNFTWSNLSGKPSTFTPSAHTHNASDINAGTLAIARIPTGTTGSTVALGNHTHTFASLTSKPTTLSGYGITDGVPTSRTLTINGTTYNLSANRSWTLGASDVGAEPAFSKNTAFNKNFGTTAGTVAEGNDSRIVNAVPNTRQINGKALSANVTLTAADVSAMPTSWTITAGNGLSGGGNGTANRTLHVVAGDGISVSSANVAVDGTVARRNAANTFSGANTFSQPVKGADAVNNDEFVTKQQVLPLATQQTGIVRVVESADAAVFNGGSGNFLKIGTTSTEWSVTIPAGTFSGGKGILELEILGSATFSSGPGLNVSIHFTQGANTFSYPMFNWGTGSGTPANGSVYYKAVFTSRQSGGLFYGGGNGLLNAGGLFPFITSGTSISNIDFRQSVTIRIQVSRQTGYNLTLLPITVKVSDL